jgi:hypothetical protein
VNGSDEDSRAVFGLESRIRATAKALNSLETGALVAFAAGAAVFGAVAGGVYWTPAAMASALLGYRGIVGLPAFIDWWRQPQLRLYDRIKE